jgi:ADP-ribosylglycohydrolase
MTKKYGRLSLVHRAFYAQAVADAVGADFEFTRDPKPKEVRAKLRSKAPLRITDDTQMAMFGQEALNQDPRRPDFEAAYLRWYATQTSTEVPDCTEGELLAFPEMHVRRAPGTGCLTQLGKLAGVKSLALKAHNAGCGSVMRLLPFAGLLLRLPHDDVEALALASARVTHAHPESDRAVRKYVAAAGLLLDGATMLHVVVDLLDAMGDAITDHGQGWTAKECVDMALWALVHARDYNHLLELAICHEGDSDSVAAVAGSLWGLAGLGGWEKYASRLAEREAIDSLFPEAQDA